MFDVSLNIPNDISLLLGKGRLHQQTAKGEDFTSVNIRKSLANRSSNSNSNCRVVDDKGCEAAAVAAVATVTATPTIAAVAANSSKLSSEDSIQAKKLPSKESTKVSPNTTAKLMPTSISSSMIAKTTNLKSGDSTDWWIRKNAALAKTAAMEAYDMSEEEWESFGDRFPTGFRKLKILGR